MPTTTFLEDKLRELALFEPQPLPVLSLYVNTQPDGTGHPNFGPFLRKELKAKAATYPLRSPERDSFDRDAEKIMAWFESELRPSANGVAIFACAGADDFFQELQLDVPIDTNELFVYDQPHLYTLARLNDQYPSYAAVIADTNSARIFVFGLATKLESDTISNKKLGRTQVGGWSQARYQRRVENLHMHHGKEVLDALEKVVREEGIQHIVFAGDEAILPVLHEQLSPFLAGKVVDELRLNVTTPEHEFLTVTLSAMREYDSRNDADEIKAFMDQYRSGGLAAAGLHDVLAALGNGQVETLFISTSFEKMNSTAEQSDNESAPSEGETAGVSPSAQLSDELVTRAKQTSAHVQFVEDETLLEPFGGVAAMLRYRIQSRGKGNEQEK